MVASSRGVGARVRPLRRWIGLPSAPSSRPVSAAAIDGVGARPAVRLRRRRAVVGHVWRPRGRMRTSPDDPTAAARVEPAPSRCCRCCDAAATASCQTPLPSAPLGRSVSPVRARTGGKRLRVEAAGRRQRRRPHAGASRRERGPRVSPPALTIRPAAERAWPCHSLCRGTRGPLACRDRCSCDQWSAHSGTADVASPGTP